MRVHKFRDKYRAKVHEAKLQWKHNNLTSGVDKSYAVVTDEYLIADMMLDAYTRSASNHPKIKSLLQEYTSDTLDYSSVKILFENGSEKEAYKPCCGTMWETERGYQVKPFDLSKSCSLNKQEEELFPQGTQVIRNDNKGNIYYNPDSHIMWKRSNSRLQRFGFISMNINSKSPDTNVPDRGRSYDQFTSLSKVFTTRTCRSKREFENDCFIKNVGEIEYKNVNANSCSKIKPIELIDDRVGRRNVDVIDYATGEIVAKKCYSLTDLVLVIDIDCGKQIDYITDIFICLKQSVI